MAEHNHDNHIHNHASHNNYTATTSSPLADLHNHHDHSHDDVVVANDSGDAALHGHGPHDTMMHMFFHGGVSEYILFEFWKTSEIGGLLGSMLAVFLLAFLYEALKFYREHLYRHSFRTIQYNTVTVPVENGGSVKETQKTVQFTTQSMSVGVDPNFQTPEITPIFITKENCHCPTVTVETNIELEPDVLISQHCSDNNISRSPSSGCGRPPLVQQSYKVKMLSLMHFWQTILHVIQVILSYFLMLIFMTYNVWLCLAVTLGAGSGYFFFGWKKSLVVDITEHCH